MNENSRDKKLVLIADDDAGMRLIARQVLEQAGLTVEEAGDGLQALRLLDELRPDLVLLDLSMPGMDGFSVCGEIRKVSSQTPVIVVTGLDDMDSINRAYEVGATDFLTKPINWPFLKQHVRYVLRASDAILELRRSEERNQALINAIPDMMFLVDSEGTYRDFKPAKDVGSFVPPGLFLGKKIPEVLPRDISDKAMRAIRRALAHQRTEMIEYELATPEGTRSYEARVVPSGGEVLAVVRDITERKRAAETLQRERDFVATVVDKAGALVMVRDRLGRIVRFNKACQDASGLKSAEAVGGLVWDLCLPAEDRAREKETFLRLLADRETSEYENQWIGPAGTPRQIAWSNSFAVDHAGEIEHVISVGIDVSDRKRSEERIRFLAYYDVLTHLPNRTLFQDELSQAIVESRKNGRPFAILFLDLDRFKQINDTFGHTLGDDVLKAVADRLQHSIRHQDTVGRLEAESAGSLIGRFGGDEFGVLLTGLRSSKDVANVARRILQNLAPPFRIQNREVFVSASIGICIHPSDGESAEVLLKNADTAMYGAKERGKNTFQFYTKSMNASAHKRLSLENDLRRALDRGELVLFYQPKLELATGRILGTEALLRWKHPKRGLVPPMEFIPLAEESGLIIHIGEWVLREACAQNLEWQRAGFEALSVGVNISGVQFRGDDLVETVLRIIDVTGLDPRCLELEITESSILQNQEKAIETMTQLKDFGARLSIDDFGTGYSSLSYLKRFPLDALKIDRAFVKDLEANSEDQAITRAIIAMAHGLGLRTVAEGVETEWQRSFLIEHGCEHVQGFLFSPPGPARHIEGLIAKQLGMVWPHSEGRAVVA